MLACPFRSPADRRPVGAARLGADAHPGEGDAGRRLDHESRGAARLEREGTITREERLDRELELGMAAVREGAYRRELLEVRSGLAAARAEMDG